MSDEQAKVKVDIPTGSANIGRKSYFELREEVQKDAKLAIARRIVEKFLAEGDSILLDAGTSLYPIAEEIASLAQKRPDTSHFTIMTHNYKAFQMLIDKVPREANLNIVLAGGRYDRDLNALFGPQTIRAYDDFFPRAVLIGISGMVADQGLFCHGNTEELSVKEVIFKKSTRTRIIVADHKKLGMPDALRFGHAKDLRANAEGCIVVTDKPKEDSDLLLRERFKRECERLEKVYSVSVETV